MTRWKLEGIVVIRTMHAHHRYSVYHDCVIRAAEELCGSVGFRRYANHSDGSESRDWYVSAPVLERAGGERALLLRAAELHDLRMTPVAVGDS